MNQEKFYCFFLTIHLQLTNEKKSQHKDLRHILHLVPLAYVSRVGGGLAMGRAMPSDPKCCSIEGIITGYFHLNGTGTIRKLVDYFDPCQGSEGEEENIYCGCNERPINSTTI